MGAKNNKIIINEKEYDLISYVTIDIGNFIVYTDNKPLGNNKVALYINRVSKNNNEILLDEVENDEITKIFNAIKERLMNNG